MGSGCCKKTKIADASLAVVQTQNEAATETPYGYVYIYPSKFHFKAQLKAVIDAWKLVKKLLLASELKSHKNLQSRDEKVMSNEL